MNLPNNNPHAYGGFGFIRAYLFRLDAEEAHEMVKRLLQWIFYIPPIKWILSWFFCRRNPHLAQTVQGLKFPTPVGLAAGFDKDGELIHGIHSLGFGFCEIGTVTLKPQIGNPKPRLSRLVDQTALINSMGFNNAGADALVGRLKRLRQHKIPIGINIGKNRDTSNNDALAEYHELLTRVYPYADYIVINVSSPNTPGLRDLQKPEFLQPLLRNLSEQGARLAVLHGVARRPIFVKLAPELNQEELESVLDIVKNIPLQGVVAVNTLKTEAGGLSGAPLRPYALKMVSSIRSFLGNEFTIIGVGGIDSPQAASQMLQAGANLVQVYTGWVYRGPLLIPKIYRYLKRQGLAR